MPRILICEDEENIISFLKTELEFEGFETTIATDGSTALEAFASAKFGLILLDIMLPHRNGLEVLREIRKTSRTPVIILTARKEVYDKVAFLNAGADDYITKPFDTLELIARIKRCIERTAQSESPAPLDSQGCAGGLSLNKHSYLAQVSGNELKLTKTEFEILLYLFEHKGIVKTRDEIIKSVFGDYYGESNIIDSNIKNIRAKLSTHSKNEIISTIRGKGYVIRA